MKEIRKGNDIVVTWSLKREGEPFILEGLSLTLYLKSMYDKEQLSDYSVSGNKIIWTFYGKDQTHTGNYSLELVANKDEKGMMTTDACNFVRIVSCSCRTSNGWDDCGIKTEVVDIESEVEYGGSIIVVDKVLSPDSENAIANNAVYREFGKYTKTEELSNLLSNKVDKESGKGLSTEDFTTALKNKLNSLSNYDDKELSEAVATLRKDLDNLVSGDTTTAIKTFNEIIAFLDGIQDTESLDSIIASIEQQIEGKQDKLVSGTNIKTINGKSILGEGNIEIEAGPSYDDTEIQNKLTELSAEFNGKRENFDIKVDSFTYVILSDYDVQDSAELSIVNTLAKKLRVDTQDSQENIVNTYIIPSESTSNIKISEGEVRLRLNSADTGSVEILFSKGIKASFVELETRTDNKIAETDAKLDQIESQTYNKVEDYEIKNDAKLAELSDTTNASIAALENQTNRELSTTNQQILQINKEFNDIVFQYEVKPSLFTYVVLSDYGLSQDESLYIKNNGSKNLRVDALDASNETLQYIIITSETEQKFLIPSGTIRLRLNSAESANVSVVVKGINSSLAELEEAVNTLNEGGLVLNESKIKEQVNSWLNSHPEATTTIQDASVTDSKIAASLKELTYNNYVTPQMFGAKGDGKTDDTNAFILAQESGKNIYVPIGQYVVNNFTFSASVEWYFQPSMGSPWFAEGCAEIHTSTGLTISNSPKIHNLVVKYNGQENDASKRPIGLKMLTHWAELHRLHISHFYIGMAFGKDAGGHSDYTRVYNANIWCCYKCGVSLDAVGESQVNFISFYDCNVGSNGVDVHNTEKEPNVERGYGFYIATCNGVAINNSDVSSNETCGFYIDASSSDKRARGLIVPTFYAEHNKYCDIYYKNGVNSVATRTGDVEFSVGYIFHNSQDIYYQANVYCENLYLPPCVKLLGVKGTEYKAEKSALLECIDMLYSVKFASDATIDKFTFFGKPRKTYKIKLLLKGISTGTITFQNIIYGAAFLDDYYSVDNRVEVQKSHNVSVVEGEEKEVEFMVSMPSTEYKLCLYNASPYGASAEVIDGSVELVVE